MTLITPPPVIPSHVMTWLLRRGITPETAAKAGLTWRGGRLGIPITRADGTVFHKWRRDPAKDSLPEAERPPKYMADKGGERTLYGAERIRTSDIIFVCEGELDAIRLMEERVVAVSSTTGASNWDPAWDELFRDKLVYVFYDSDEPGRDGAFAVASRLAATADSASVVCMDEKFGKDVTEYFQRLVEPIEQGSFVRRLIGGTLPGISVLKLSWRPPQGLPKREFTREDAPPILHVLESRYGIKFRKTGREYLGLCTIHGDKNPSMSVNAEKGLFNCHACGAAGSVYDFVMRMENCDFKEAKKLIAA